MKFWVYSIDWRTAAVEILAEMASESLANEFAAGYIASLPVAERDDFVTFSTIGITPITPVIEAAVEDFKRLVW